MRSLRSSVAVVAAALLLAACGETEGPNSDDPGGPGDVYTANVNAQCIDVRERRESIPLPEVDNVPELADYLQKNVALAEEFNRTLESIDPPAEKESVHRRAQRAARELSEVVAGYERAAEGGRGFDATLSGLEPEVNSVLRRTNPQFEDAGLTDCVQKELDFGYSQDPPDDQ